MIRIAVRRHSLSRSAGMGLLSALLLTGCANGPPAAASAPIPPQPAAVAQPAAPATPPATVITPEQQADFSRWLEGVRQEAEAQGITKATLDLALSNVQELPRVIDLDRKQPEGTVTFATYADRVLTKDRIQRGREMMRQNAALLAQVSARYHVQPQYIVALWGLETNYGRITGGFRIIDALATLAHDGRRPAYFRKELIQALRIVQEDKVDPATMKGSWAGAMGQVQFMPSAFFKFAQDFDGCGRRDIWTKTPDVLASAANYLSTVGWDATTTWGREVTLPAKGLDAAAAAGLDKKRTLAEWGRAGVKTVDGKPLPARALSASLVIPDGPTGRAFLVYDNYRAIMNWNRSTYFATTVGLLADQLGAAP
ncbi:lytic murein transglycosylase [Nitrospirillum pindoramense]|uniref:Membrane-bound lytic murein transglycosylase B n=1 Tax=Nitrospirillum amazonense TaxID=28077 RepID=A0A560HDI4_9PROT|nr:lytic murein transglycosylase [Nitrospirillum amazonense]TWB43759.1 membrane-bound lytic murein transglycosylase B [Nitrospirillum amazonense]